MGLSEGSHFVARSKARERSEDSRSYGNLDRVNLTPSGVPLFFVVFAVEKIKRRTPDGVKWNHARIPVAAARLRFAREHCYGLQKETLRIF